MNLGPAGGLLPRPVRRWILHFEAQIEDAVIEFAASLPGGARILDAGAGEGQYRQFFPKQRYCGLDLSVGDVSWDYSSIDVRGDLAALPFPDSTFDAALNVVTLEHVQEPQRVLCELARTLKPGGKLLIVVPLEWEEHQQPHDYFRFTRFGIEYLLEKSGFRGIEIRAGGGYFRLLARRLAYAGNFFPVWLAVPVMLVVAIPVLLLPVLDPLDSRQNFTLGYICSARKPF